MKMKNIFLQNVPLDTQNAVLTSVPKIFCQKSTICFAQSLEMIIGIILFFILTIFPKKFLWKRFHNPVRSFFYVFSQKKLGFSEKNLIFFQNRFRCQFCCKCISTNFISQKRIFLFNCEFFQKIRKILFLDKLQVLTNKQYSFGKNAVILSKGTFNKIGGQKIGNC